MPTDELLKERVLEDLIIEQLDFEPVTACELPRMGCTKVASWLVVCPNCKASAPSCTNCLERLRTELRDMQTFAQIFHGVSVGPMCNVCRGTGPQGCAFDEWWIVAPLKVGA